MKSAQKYISLLLNRKVDYKTIKSHYNKGSLYKNQYYFLPK